MSAGRYAEDSASVSWRSTPSLGCWEDLYTSPSDRELHPRREESEVFWGVLPALRPKKYYPWGNMH